MNPDANVTHKATVVSRFLVALVSAVCRHPRSVLGLSVALCVLAVYAALFHLQYHAQRDDLISPRKDYQQRWRRYLAEFGDDDDMVVVVQGTDRRRMALSLEAVAGQIRQRPDLFDRLFYKIDLRHLHNRALVLAPEKQLAQIQNSLKDMGLLLQFGPLSWQALSLHSLVREGLARLARLGPDEKLSPADEQFFGQLVAITQAASATLADPAHYRKPWGSLMAGGQDQQKDMLAEPQFFFSDGGSPGEGVAHPCLAFLLVRPVKEVGSFTAALGSVSALRGIVAGVRGDYPGVDFGLTGMPVLETDEMVSAKKDTHMAGWVAILGVTFLFLLVYRGLAYPLLTVVTLLTGTAWAMGWATLTIGHLNILSATFAVMLIGMGDYGVLWVMRYEQARRRGADVRSALLHTTTHVAIGNLTAASTLALAFFAAILADFKAVAELGWIAGCGVFLCALACFTVLPALLILFDRRFPGRPVGDPEALSEPEAPVILPLVPPGADTWLPGLARRPGWVMAAGLLIVATLGMAATRVRYDHNLLHLQAGDLESVRWEMVLMEHTRGASWHALSYRPTAEETLALKARLESLPNVSKVVEVASLVPPDQSGKLPLLRDIQERLAALPERGRPIPHVRPSSQALQADTVRLGQQLQQTATHRPLLADLAHQVAELQRQLRQLPDPDQAGRRLHDFDQRLAGDLAEDLHRLRDVSTPEPITVADLPAELRERYLGKTGHWLLQVFARDCLWEFAPMEHFTKQIRKVDVMATGKPFGTVEGLKAMKNGLQRAGLYAFLVIALILYFDFRTPTRMLLALMPLVMGVILTLGIMGLSGMPLNPANMIAFPLILGVGVDNGVHVLHDYLIRRGQGQPLISYAIGRGVLVKALTTMIGFGALMVSTERGLSGLGVILTLGVGCSMLSALVFLPAVLYLVPQRPRAAVPDVRPALRRAA